MIKYKILYVVFVSCYFFVSCYQEGEIERIHFNDKAFDSKYFEEDFEIGLDFSLNDSLFVKDVEKRYNIDLCENPNIDVVLDFKKLHKKIVVPVYVFKLCPYVIRCGRFNMDFTINDSGYVLMNHELITNNATNVAQQIFEKIKEYNATRNRRKVSIDFYWEKGIKRTLVDQKFKELLKGVYLYKNHLSQQLFQKSYTACTMNEIEKINDQLMFYLHIKPSGLETPPPPPPPFPEELLNESS